jgi:KDO2-lipid IV(A) lauroyltransferase
MMLLIKLIAWSIAHVPDFAKRAVFITLGSIAYYLSNRGHLVRSNLHHAFPEESPEWIRKAAKENLARMFEMFFLPFALHYYTRDEIQKRLKADKKYIDLVNSLDKERGTIILSPHTTITEFGPCLPLIFDVKDFGIFYRPIDNKVMEQFVLNVRSRFGVTMLSRREGLLKSGHFLKNGNWVGILFDQNAGSIGTLTTFFDRVASSIELPGLLSKKYNSRLVMIYFQRTGIWRGKVVAEVLPEIEDVKEKTAYIQYHLEEKIKSHKDERVDWFWAHNRWKTQRELKTMFRLEHKKMALNESLAIRGQKEIPRNLRMFIRFGDDVTQALEFLPLIGKLRKSRPDLQVTVLAPSKIVEVCQKQQSGADAFIPIPKNASEYKGYLKSLPNRYPDIFLILETNEKAVHEAIVSKARQRMGMMFSEKRIKGIKQSWECPKELKEKSFYEQWEAFFIARGMKEE